MMFKTSLVNKIILILFILVAFVPHLNTQDRGLVQWFYLSLLNIISAIYIFTKRKEYKLFFSSKIILSVFLGGLLFLGVAFLSMINATMISESIVTLMYLIVTLLSFIIIFFIIKQNPKEYFEFFVLLILGWSFIEVYQVCSYFIENNKEVRSSELLRALPHNYGNRNILSASIAMKFPFIIYSFITFKNRFLKFGSLMLLFLLLTALLLIGARTAIFSTTILLISILVYLFIIEKEKIKGIKYKVFPILVVPFFAMLLGLNLNKIHKHKFNSLNNIFSTKSKKDLHKKANTSKEVSVTSSSGRDYLWESALIEFKKSPLLGIGVGNWKIKEKESFLKNVKKKTASSPKRVHNDFLQILSEMGVLGFLIFISFFLVISYMTLMLFLKYKKENQQSNNLIIGILFASFLIYSMDALFNFPHERPPIQILFFIVITFLLSFVSDKKKYAVNMKLAFPVLFVFLIGGSFISYKVFAASRIQRKLQNTYEKKDMQTSTYDMTYEEACAMLPDFPQLDARARPNEIIKAIFAINQKKDKAALRHLDVSIQQFPFIAENFSFKGLLFIQGNKETRNLDSALFYAKKAFDIQPSMKVGYNILRNIYLIRKDTANMLGTFNTFLKTVPKDVDSWIDKANYLKRIKKSDEEILQVIDSAILFNPSERRLKIYKNELKGIKKKPLTGENSVATYFKRGVDFFNKNDFNNSKKDFLKVIELNPMHYSGLLYLGLSELNLKAYKNAIYYFTKVIDAKQINTGYVEYNRGVAYYNSGEKEKALNDFIDSKNKGYVKASAMIEKINIPVSE